MGKGMILETAVALSPCCEVGIAERIEEDVTVTIWVSAVFGIIAVVAGEHRMVRRLPGGSA